MGKPNSAARIFLRTIWRERAEDLHEQAALFHADRAAFDETAEQSRRTGDLGREIAAGKLAHRYGQLSRKGVRRLSRLLTGVARFEEALSCLGDPSQAKQPAAEHWLGRAEALAGLGRLEDALRTAQHARASEVASERTEPLIQGLSELAALQTRRGELTAWPDFARLIDGHLEFGACDLAAQAMEMALRKASPLAPDDMTAFWQRLQLVLQTVEPRWVTSLLCAMRPLAAQLGGEGEIDQVLRQVTGLAGASCDQDGAALALDLDLQGSLALACAAAGLKEEAVFRLGPPAGRIHRAQASRIALARCVGEAGIQASRPRFHSRGRRKIVDVFPFFDELLMLQLRLEEMAEWVDHFVLLEATTTFAGRPKPMYFQENRERFRPYLDKIVHVPVVFPAHVSSHWAREFHQRDAAIRILPQICSSDDLVLLTDVDEMVDRRAIEAFSGQFATLAMNTYAFFFNLRKIEDPPMTRGAVWRAKLLENVGMSYGRLAPAGLIKGVALPEAGWHFTSIRPTEDLPTKFSNYSHVQYADLDESYFEALLARIRSGEEPGYEPWELDDRFPAAVRRNCEALAQFIL